MTVRELLGNMYYGQELRMIDENNEICFLGTNAQTRSGTFKNLLDKQVVSFGSNYEYGNNKAENAAKEYWEKIKENS